MVRFKQLLVLILSLFIFVKASTGENGSLRYECPEGILPLTQDLKWLKHHMKEEEFLCKYEQLCEEGCICCQYGNCDCKSRCPEGCECFNSNKSLTSDNYFANVVKCQGVENGLQTIREIPMHATHIFLSGMNLPILQSHDFMGRTRLVQLQINFSNLTTIQPLAFNALPKLRILDLSGNMLTRINGDEAFKTSKLRSLNLENNKLGEIDPRLTESMPKLEQLLLANNAFDDLPSYLNEEIADKNLKRISLKDNPFRCDCLNARPLRIQDWLRNWTLEANDLLLDASEIKCIENVTRALIFNDTTVLSFFPPNNGADIFEIPMLDFIKQENASICLVKSEDIFGGSHATNILLTLATVAFAVLIVTAILYLIFVTLSRGQRSTRCQYRKTNLSPTDTPAGSPIPNIPTNGCDIFISYSKRDELHVIESLCRPLENNGFTLCLLHREGSRFNSGIHAVSDELIGRMELCETLMLVLTKNFIDDEWRSLQIKTSHRLFAKIKHKRLVAIIGEEICPNELDEELGQILRRTTCIMMNHHLFWNLLTSALPPPVSKMRVHSRTASETSQIYSDIYGTTQVPSEIV